MKKLKMKTMVTMFICIILLAFPLCACSGGVGGTRIDLNKYIVVSLDGYDGSGTVSVGIDRSALDEDYANKVKTSSDAEFLYGGETTVGTVVSDFADIYPSPSSALKNGDVIELNWSVQESTIEALCNCTVSYSNQTYTVEGLEEAPHYVTSFDEIPEDSINQMVAEGEDVFQASTASWDPHARLNSVNYIGSYFLSAKDWLTGTTGDTSSVVTNKNANIIYMIYEVSVSQFGVNDDGSQSETNTTYYWYISFYDGMISPDGIFSIDLNNHDEAEANSYFWNISGDGFYVTTYDATQNEDIQLVYSGFESLDDAFDNLVTARIEEYNYENTVQ